MFKIKRNGLTLIEVLVAVAIIAILSAGLYSVSNYIDMKIKIARTKSTLHILVTALERYHEFYGRFPIIDDVNDSADYAKENYPDAGKKMSSIEKAYYRLSLAPESKKIIGHIERKMVKDKDKDGFPEVYDVWGTVLMYEYESGDNFPVVLSFGPDKVKNSKDDISSKDDDVSSKGL